MANSIENHIKNIQSVNLVLKNNIQVLKKKISLIEDQIICYSEQERQLKEELRILQNSKIDTEETPYQKDIARFSKELPNLLKKLEDE